MVGALRSHPATTAKLINPTDQPPRREQRLKVEHHGQRDPQLHRAPDELRLNQPTSAFQPPTSADQDKSKGEESREERCPGTGTRVRGSDLG
jgi:hypothetical protein